MAITQLNPNAGLLDYEAMLETLIATYTGKPTITLTNYDNDSAPQVTAGSIFENNGTLFSNDALATPTGYAGISNSTTFYLYYNSSSGAFIYYENVPVWSDAKQGWYGAAGLVNFRALFSMFKDSGGTLYQRKSLLMNKNDTQVNGFIHLAGPTEAGDVFDAMNAAIPETGDTMIVAGGIRDGGPDGIATSYAIRTDATTITLHGNYVTKNGLYSVALVEASSGTPFVAISVAW